MIDGCGRRRRRKKLSLEGGEETIGRFLAMYCAEAWTLSRAGGGEAGRRAWYGRILWEEGWGWTGKGWQGEEEGGGGE